MSVSNVTTPLTVTRRRMTSLVFRGQYVRVIKSVLKLMRCESCVVCQILITTTSSTVDTTAAAAGAIVSRSWFSLSLSLSLSLCVCECVCVDSLIITAVSSNLLLHVVIWHVYCVRFARRLQKYLRGRVLTYVLFYTNLFLNLSLLLFRISLFA